MTYTTHLEHVSVGHKLHDQRQEGLGAEHLLELHHVRVQQALVVHDLSVRVLHIALSAAQGKGQSKSRKKRRGRRAVSIGAAYQRVSLSLQSDSAERQQERGFVQDALAEAAEAGGPSCQHTQQRAAGSCAATLHAAGTLVAALGHSSEAARQAATQAGSKYLSGLGTGGVPRDTTEGSQKAREQAADRGSC